MRRLAAALPSDTVTPRPDVESEPFNASIGLCSSLSRDHQNEYQRAITRSPSQHG